MLTRCISPPSQSYLQRDIVSKQVITLWFDVQRTWSHLESIFIGSEDIRPQLPVDSERFDDTNERFVEKLKVITRIPNIIEATSTPGLAEELEVRSSECSCPILSLTPSFYTSRGRCLSICPIVGDSVPAVSL